MCRPRCCRLPCLVVGRRGPHDLLRGLATSWVVFSSPCLTPCLKFAGMPRRMILSLSSVASSQRILYYLEAWPVKIKIKETVEVVHLLKFWSLRCGTFPNLVLWPCVTTAAAASCWHLTQAGNFDVFSAEFKGLLFVTTAAAASCRLLTSVGNFYVFSAEFKVLLNVTSAAAASCRLLTFVCVLNVSSVSGHVSWNTGCRVPLLGGIVSLTQVADWFTAAAFTAAAAFRAFCGTFTFVFCDKISYLGIGLVTTTPSSLESIGCV